MQDGIHKDGATLRCATKGFELSEQQHHWLGESEGFLFGCWGRMCGSSENIQTPPYLEAISTRNTYYRHKWLDVSCDAQQKMEMRRDDHHNSAVEDEQPSSWGLVVESRGNQPMRMGIFLTPRICHALCDVQQTTCLLPLSTSIVASPFGTWRRTPACGC